MKKQILGNLIIIYVSIDENIAIEFQQNMLKEWEKYYSPKFKDYTVVCIPNSNSVDFISFKSGIHKY